MNLRPGMKVWVGWCPDYDTTPDGRAYRLRVGEIDSLVLDLIIRPPAWRVIVDGVPVIVNEALLTPFDDDIEVESDEAEATA